MDLSELRYVLGKLELLEARTFTPEQICAWFDILGQHSLKDASEAVLAFHSKPYKRPAYPGDLKAHILENEGVRLRRCGTLEANAADHVDGHGVPPVARLRALVATGEWSAADYRAYRRSGQSIEEFQTAEGALRVG
ncbi:hypothetical protein G9E11_01965 [Arthrobacter sp. IA7]|uniref:hypothetical protein n=1 Tax=Arthrobacter ipis TaxID=2716202 RepID=UPI001686701E|nr:hypothetical protein [Arthrobacter ipis]MBD1541040.1 hypothetical protein [Arthrobacter ipis]